MKSTETCIATDGNDIRSGIVFTAPRPRSRAERRRTARRRWVRPTAAAAVADAGATNKVMGLLGVHRPTTRDLSVDSRTRSTLCRAAYRRRFSVVRKAS